MSHAVSVVLHHDFPELQMQFSHLVVFVDDSFLFKECSIFLLQLFSEIDYDIFESHDLETVFFLLFGGFLKFFLYLDLSFDKFGHFFLIGLGELLLFGSETENKLLILFLFSFDLWSFFFEFAHHSSRVFSKILNVLSILLSYVDKSSIVMEAEIIE